MAAIGFALATMAGVLTLPATPAGAFPCTPYTCGYDPGTVPIQWTVHTMQHMTGQVEATTWPPVIGQTDFIRWNVHLQEDISTGKLFYSLTGPNGRTESSGPICGAVPSGSETIPSFDPNLIAVPFFGVPVLPVNAPCPITAGSYDTGLVPFTIPRDVQPGTYVLQVQMTDQTSSTVLLADLSMSLAEDSDLALTGVPANITTNANGPTGAVVNYTPPTATDEGDETPPVVCAPLSGTVFVIGKTTVTCTVTDSDDSNSPQTATFSVTVNGALAQLQNPLLPDVRTMPATVGRLILVNDINGMISNLQAGRTASVCSELSFMQLVVQAWSGSSLMTTAQAETILADVNQISAVLGCNAGTPG